MTIGRVDENLERAGEDLSSSEGSSGVRVSEPLGEGEPKPDRSRFLRETKLLVGDFELYTAERLKLKARVSGIFENLINGQSCSFKPYSDTISDDVKNNLQGKSYIGSKVLYVFGDSGAQIFTLAQLGKALEDATLGDEDKKFLVDQYFPSNSLDMENGNDLLNWQESVLAVVMGMINTVYGSGLFALRRSFGKNYVDEREVESLFAPK